MVNLDTEFVSITTHGVWHTLYEALSGKTNTIPNPTKIRICDLLGLCPEISTEYEKNFRNDAPLIQLYSPSFYFDEKASESWISFSVARGDLKRLKLSRPRFLFLYSTSPGHIERSKAATPTISCSN